MHLVFGVLKELTFSDGIKKGDSKDTRVTILFLRPAPFLLLKAKHCRPKDQFDLETAMPYLSQAEKHGSGSNEKEYPKVTGRRNNSSHFWLTR